MSPVIRVSGPRRRSRGVVIAGGGVVVAAAVAAALALGGAASASGGTTDPSIRQLPDGSWIAEDTLQDSTVIENGSAPEQMIKEGSGVSPDSDMLPSGPASMIEEGSGVDPDSDMLIAPEPGQL